MNKKVDTWVSGKYVIKLHEYIKIDKIIRPYPHYRASYNYHGMNSEPWCYLYDTFEEASRACEEHKRKLRECQSG